jgi:hypothetical protein
MKSLFPQSGRRASLCLIACRKLFPRMPANSSSGPRIRFTRPLPLNKSKKTSPPSSPDRSPIAEKPKFIAQPAWDTARPRWSAA